MGNAPDVSISRLPVTNRELFGRESELAWLDRCWAEGVRVASIVAWGGVGKSALVNAWLRGMDKDGWRGAERVFGWSFYSQGTDRLSSSDEFIEVALRGFGDADPSAGSPWDKGERLARLVRKERTILILDGVEPLQSAPGVDGGRLQDPALQALVREMGALNKGLCLITTRIEVADLEAWGGEKVQAHGLDHLSAEAGADLLKARGAKGAEEDLQAAAAEYDGHSLALTLLGNYIRKRHNGNIRQRAHIPLPKGKPAQRMMGIYERWFAGKPEIAILRLLGLFDRPTREDEVAALRAKPPIAALTMFLKGLNAGAWDEAVTTLQDVGLLAPGLEGGESLDAHPLVREHFAQMLRREHPAAWREGHRRLYEHLRGRAEALPNTIDEMAPLYAAVVHGCMAGKNQDALHEVFLKRIWRGDQGFSLKQLGTFSSEVATLYAFFDLSWEQLVPGLRELDQALVLRQAGIAHRALGRLPEAARLMRNGLEKSLAQGDWKNAAMVAANISEILQTRGELREALTQVRKCVELADKSGDLKRRMINRTTLATALHAMGLWDEAAMQFEEAERMQRERPRGTPWLFELWGFRYCEMLLEQGRGDDVRRRALQALRWGGTHYPRLDIALDHLSLGRAHLFAVQGGTAGDLTQAACYLHQAVDHLRYAGRQDFLPLGLLARAALHTHTRAFDLARRDLTEALTLATRCGFRLHEADAHLGHARLSLAEGDPASACLHLSAARAIIDATGYHRRDVDLTEIACALECGQGAVPPGARS